MTDLPGALRTELNELEAELRKDPRYQRMRLIEELLHQYEPNGPAEAPTSKRDKIVAELKTYLRHHGATHRVNIANHLVSKGLMGKEANPLKALAIYLSEAKDIFGSDGDGNWFLKPTP